MLIHTDTHKHKKQKTDKRKSRYQLYTYIFVRVCQQNQELFLLKENIFLIVW